MVRKHPGWQALTQKQLSTPRAKFGINAINFFKIKNHGASDQMFTPRGGKLVRTRVRRRRAGSVGFVLRMVKRRRR
jgi:hypothetical protein